MFISRKNVVKLLFIVLLNHQAYADEQQILLDQPESAKELGKIIFSNDISAVNSGALRTRSINFIKKDKASTISVGMPIKFAYNSAHLQPDAQPYLDGIGKMLNLEEFIGHKLVIEGHTDASGSRAYNQQLSETRAQTIRDYLITRYQIASQRLVVLGRGEDQLVPGSNPHGGINRRVQFYKAN